MTAKGNFKHCANKAITTTFTPKKDGINEGHLAELECPRTEDLGISVRSEYYNHNTKQEAIGSLRNVAALAVCGTCEYHDMTPVQVNVRRAEEARTETEWILAKRALDQARAEVSDIPSLPHTIH